MVIAGVVVSVLLTWHYRWAAISLANALLLCLGLLVLNEFLWLALREFLLRSRTGESEGAASPMLAAADQRVSEVQVRQRRRTIIDDRNRSIQVLRKWDDSNYSAELPAKCATRVRAVVNRGYFGRWRWRAFALVGTIGLYLWGLLAIRPFLIGTIGQLSGWKSLLVPALIAMVFCFLVWGAFSMERSLARRRVSKVLLIERYCPCCLYPLFGLSAQSDGCTVCPECGAAWRLECLG